MRDAVLTAEFVEQALPLDAQRGLKRTGRVVNPGVQDPAVMGARLHPWPRAAFYDANLEAREGELGCARESHDPCTDYDRVRRDVRRHGRRPPYCGRLVPSARAWHARGPAGRDRR